jgi:hypothetical protein
MKNVSKNRASRKIQWVQSILLVLALLTSPVLCCGGLQFLDALPSSWLPPWLDFTLNIFEGSARVENKTPQVLYVTAITTSYGAPRVISQNIAFRQRHIPVKPQSSVVLEYDSADLPLSGIIVCKSTEDCRLLPVNNSRVYVVESYESLEKLEPDWLEASRAIPLQNNGALMVAVLSFVSIILFLSWAYLKWSAKKRSG